MNTLPPPQYDVLPPMPVIEHVLTSDLVDRACQAIHALGRDGRPPPPGYRFYGCAHVTAKSCEVWRIDDATTRRHELAHCAGWPGDHPDHYVVPPPKPAAPSPVVTAVKVRPYNPDPWASSTPLAPAIPDAVFRAISGPPLDLAPWPIREVTKND